MDDTRNLATSGASDTFEAQGYDERLPQVYKRRNYIAGGKWAFILRYMFLGVLCCLGLLLWHYQSHILRAGRRVILAVKMIARRGFMSRHDQTPSIPSTPGTPPVSALASSTPTSSATTQARTTTQSPMTQSIQITGKQRRQGRTAGF